MNGILKVLFAIVFIYHDQVVEGYKVQYTDSLNMLESLFLIITITLCFSIVI